MEAWAHHPLQRGVFGFAEANVATGAAAPGVGSGMLAPFRDRRTPLRGALLSVGLLFCSLVRPSLAVPGQAAAPLTLRFVNAGAAAAVVVTAPTGQVLLFTPHPNLCSAADLRRTYRINRIDVVVPRVSESAARRHTFAAPCPAIPSAGRRTGGPQWDLPGRPLRTQTQFNFGEVRILVITPPEDAPRTARQGTALRIEYGDFSALLVGETSAAQTEGWLRAFHGQPLGPVDVYGTVPRSHVAGDTEEWLRSVRPRNVIVQVGEAGRLPTSVPRPYNQMGAAVWRTDRQGMVTVNVRANGWYQIKAERGPATGVLPPVGQAVPALPPSLDQLPPTFIPDGN